ncbi:hypothetical protein [Clavibacter zhangzhiyongii]|uniref:hypothetical protein n=1 Tax=Clavibacter zhangzhiyongii TaxID=2768071 RepID=UPI0039DFBF27
MLGIGTTASPALRGEARRVVAALLPVVAADDGPRVVACDLPSGIGCGRRRGAGSDRAARRRHRHLRRGQGRPPARARARARGAASALVDVGLDLSGTAPLVRAAR